MLSESILSWLASFLCLYRVNTVINELVLRESGVEELGWGFTLVITLGVYLLMDLL